MVLTELGERITRAIIDMSDENVIDQRVFNDCLDAIARALIGADVHMDLVGALVNNVKNNVNFNKRKIMEQKNVEFNNLCAGLNKRMMIEQNVFNELCKLLDPGKPVFTPQKGKTSVVMMVGLQGSGKTTTCAKYAYHYKKQGWKPALVCADTFRAGAFDQLKLNATKVNIPCHGSYWDSDPVNVAVEGVEKFKNENHDLIIVDTSALHTHEAALFAEMCRLYELMRPDLVILVMDSSIGQAAFDQAQAFNQGVHIGAVIVTKLDGHAKGGGALSAVAATKTPIVFIGTGEFVDELEALDSKTFVHRLLDRSNLSEIDISHENAPVDQQTELQRTMSDVTSAVYQRRMRFLEYFHKINPPPPSSSQARQPDK